MVLKIKANILKNFIKKTTANGTISDCKLQFQKDGLFISGKDQPGVILIAGMLNKKAFNSYEELEINIKSSKVLINVLGTFKDNIINIVTDNNMIKVMDENGGIDLAMAEEVMSFKKDIPDLKYNDSVIVKKSMIDTIIERNSIINSDEINISIKDKKLLFNIGKDIDKANIFELTNNTSDITVNFDLKYFKLLTIDMDTIIDLYLSDKYPSKFIEKSEMFKIEYYLTAISENE